MIPRNPFPFGWDLPPGVSDRDIDEAAPGYWDEPEDGEGAPEPEEEDHS